MNNRCNCWKPLSIRRAVGALVEETCEFVLKPSLDEFDDMKVCLNRLVGSLINQATFDLVATPRYDAKVGSRMKQYGCIRSTRHLVDGRCPSLFMQIQSGLEFIKS